MRHWAAIVALFLALHTSHARAQSTDGKLSPEILLDGKASDGWCSFVARSQAATFESTSGSSIDLPAGDYTLSVSCKTGDETIAAPAPGVKVQAGKIATPKIDVRAARFRVEARRNGIMLPAKVALFAAGAKERVPIATFVANQKQVVSQGRYDIDVRLDDPRSPRAQVLLTGKTIGGSKVTVIEADLSDGGLIVGATMNGKKTSAAVRVFAPDSEKDLASVEAGEEVRLPAGAYTVATEARETSDFATKKREVRIVAGKTERYAESFESGLLSVSVTRDGKPAEATVRLSRPHAADFFNYFAAPGTVALSPGAYDVSIDAKGLSAVKNLIKPGVKVARGDHARASFDLTQATLTVKVTKSGAPANAEIVVRAAGGGESAGAPDGSGVFRLWPGRYEVLARLEDGEEMLDGPFEVALGQKIARSINVLRVSLIVNAMRGKAAASDADILIFRPGATKPTAKGRSGAKLEMTPGTYDVKVVAGKDSAWREGVKVKSAQTLRIDLPIAPAGPEEPLPEGDVAAPNEEMPEGDAPTNPTTQTGDAGPPDAGRGDR